ncbi:hypothetical protein DQ384_39380 [Sphaerisporangium album]|uniref:Uncharacterized protein n=1 Tax=Sphaerisporangium album TaxID=509200 RepID=A0A367EIH9_9ACTN|nr:hypothetical protein [Sphaerisporangium album]RCG17908.1 hypothetical protein DQ384_39380 [Sphaerisporangium album]
MTRQHREQASTDPERTEHLRAGQRITLDELAVHLDAVAVLLRQLAVAAETPAVPIELGDNLCERLDSMAKDLEVLGRDVGRADTIITEFQPLRPFMPDRAPWGVRAHGSDRDKWGKRLSTVLSLRQILAQAAEDLRWRDEEPGIPYLAGLDGLPGLEEWESVRAARRRAAAREAAIQAEARQQRCSTCRAMAGTYCRTKNGHLAGTFHKPRLAAATKTVDERIAEGEAP